MNTLRTSLVALTLAMTSACAVDTQPIESTEQATAAIQTEVHAFVAGGTWSVNHVSAVQGVGVELTVDLDGDSFQAMFVPVALDGEGMISGVDQAAFDSLSYPGPLSLAHDGDWVGRFVDDMTQVSAEEAVALLNGTNGAGWASFCAARMVTTMATVNGHYGLLDMSRRGADEEDEYVICPSKVWSGKCNFSECLVSRSESSGSPDVEMAEVGSLGLNSSTTYTEDVIGSCTPLQLEDYVLGVAVPIIGAWNQLSRFGKCGCR